MDNESFSNTTAPFSTITTTCSALPSCEIISEFLSVQRAKVPLLLSELNQLHWMVYMDSLCGEGTIT